MIRVRPIKATKHGDIASYLTELGSQSSNVVGYYRAEGGGAPSQWMGEGAKVLGLNGEVNIDDLKPMLEGHLPNGEDLSKSHSNRRLGDEYVISAPKSVSILATHDQRVLEWHDQAVKDAAKFIEQNMVFARLGMGGTESQYGVKTIMAGFRHATARPIDGMADPDIHTHLVVVNAAQRKDGEWRAINNDIGTNGELLQEADAIYKARLAQLLREHGYKTRLTESGFEIDGIEDKHIEAFSRRRQDILEDLRGRGQDEHAPAAVRDRAWNATRGSKKLKEEADQLYEWRSRIREEGVPIQKIIREAKAQEELGIDRVDYEVRDIVTTAMNHLSERDTTFSVSTLKREALHLGMKHGLKLEDVDRVMEDMRESGEIIRNTVIDRDGTGKMREMATTREALIRENSILKMARDGHDKRQAVMDETKANDIIRDTEEKQGWNYSNGQRNAIRLALTSKDQHIGIVGAAGAGKTTAMKVVVEHYKKAGYEVIGLAPSAKAAKELESAGCETMTLEKFLLSKNKGEKPKVYIMDEAGMVSARDYYRFLKRANNEGAITISVGDPKQLQAVQAGVPFEQLLKTGALRHESITQINRQKDEKLLKIAQAFADGRPDEGVRLAKDYMRQVDYDKPKDKAKAKENRLEALANAAAESYLRLDKNERENTLVLAAKNETRQRVNEKIREGLIERGDIGDKAITIRALDKVSITDAHKKQAHRYKEGWIIEIGRDDKDKGLIRGERYEVTGIKGDTLELKRIQEGKREMTNIEKVKALIDDGKRTVNPKFVDSSMQVYSQREMELRDGDKVMFRKNDKDRNIRNGDEGVVKIKNGRAFISGVEINRDGDVIDYAYCKTVHASQGATVNRSIVIGEGGKDSANLGYVALSREKHNLEIITDDINKTMKSWSKFAESRTAKDLVYGDQQKHQEQPAPHMDKHRDDLGYELER